MIVQRHLIAPLFYQKDLVLVSSSLGAGTSL
jgi:hypothetical protein